MELRARSGLVLALGERGPWGGFMKVDVACQSSRETLKGFCISVALDRSRLGGCVSAYYMNIHVYIYIYMRTAQAFALAIYCHPNGMTSSVSLLKVPLSRRLGVELYMCQPPLVDP